MKRVIVTALISMLALSVAAPAPAAGPTVKSLARQIKALQKDVKKLKADLRETRAVAATALIYGGCATAVTADALQSTWAFLDAKHATGFGAQTPVSDFQTCQLLRITRQPTQSPPNNSVFSSLLALFRS
jgi:hypothetical protein